MVPRRRVSCDTRPEPARGTARHDSAAAWEDPPGRGPGTNAPTATRALPPGLPGGMRNLGYVEGQTIVYDYRCGQGQTDRLPALARELVQRTPDLLWTHSNPGALSAKQATTTIPIVVGVAIDLVGIGITESIARPGGNLTGLELRPVELAGKRLELFKETVPTITRVAVLVDTGVDSACQHSRHHRAGGASPETATPTRGSAYRRGLRDGLRREWPAGGPMR